MTETLKTLLLTLRYPHRASYYEDWAEAFETTPHFNTVRESLFTLRPRRFARMLREYDLIVLLHSCTADSTRELARISAILAERNKPRLLAFVGNEYNSPLAPIKEKLAVLRACRPDWIATQLLEEAGRHLYAQLGARLISLPHALNPAVFEPGRCDRQRSIDIGVRGSRYSALLGDDDRNRIVDHFSRQGPGYGLHVDINSKSRLDHPQWAAFLGACRGTVSSEAGSWYLQRDDTLIDAVITYLESRRPALMVGYTSPGRRLARRLPHRIKTALTWLLLNGPVRYAPLEDLNLDFRDLYERFFKNAPQCPAYSKAISSRHLEAAGTLTCQILLHGRYNDILRPDEHYIPVSPGLCDVQEAVERFKDVSERRRIAQQAYHHLMSAHTYRHRMANIYALVQVP